MSILASIYMKTVSYVSSEQKAGKEIRYVSVLDPCIWSVFSAVCAINVTQLNNFRSFNSINVHLIHKVKTMQCFKGVLLCSFTKS